MKFQNLVLIKIKNTAHIQSNSKFYLTLVYCRIFFRVVALCNASYGATPLAIISLLTKYDFFVEPSQTLSNIGETLLL